MKHGGPAPRIDWYLDIVLYPSKGRVKYDTSIPLYDNPRIFLASQSTPELASATRRQNFIRSQSQYLPPADSRFWKGWQFRSTIPDVLILRRLLLLSPTVTAKPHYAGQPEFSEQTIEKDMGTFRFCVFTCLNCSSRCGIQQPLTQTCTESEASPYSQRICCRICWILCRRISMFRGVKT